MATPPDETEAERCALNELAAARERLRQVTAERDSAFQDAEQARQRGRKEAIAEIVALLQKEHAAGSFGTPAFWARVIEEKCK